jgi:hypothetical protein
MCSCGQPEAKGVNHRKTIPCWVYVGNVRMDITPAMFPLEVTPPPDSTIVAW